MAASHEWTEWHLTPKGWVKGTEKTDFSKFESPVPDDAVLTCRYIEHVSSMYSPLAVSINEVWRDESKGELIASLLKKFGQCPKGL